jgi:hypothetical protein
MPRNPLEPKPQGIMGALDSMQKRMGTSVGVTSSLYNQYRDGFQRALDKARMAMPYTARYGMTPAATIVPSAFQAATTGMAPGVTAVAGRVPAAQTQLPGIPQQSSIYETKVPPLPEPVARMPKIKPYG